MASSCHVIDQFNYCHVTSVHSIHKLTELGLDTQFTEKALVVIIENRMYLEETKLFKSGEETASFLTKIEKVLDCFYYAPPHLFAYSDAWVTQIVCITQLWRWWMWTGALLNEWTGPFKEDTRFHVQHRYLSTGWGWTSPLK